MRIMFKILMTTFVKCIIFQFPVLVRSVKTLD